MPQVILLTDITGFQLGYGKYAGTYKVATEIRKAGYTCQVIDNYVSLGPALVRNLFKKFIDESTALIGVSCTLNEKGNMHWGIPDEDFKELIAYAKELNPNIKIVVGGARISEHMSWDYIDFSIVGKADNSIIHLLEHVIDRKKLKYMKVKNTKVVKNDLFPYTQEQFETDSIEYQYNDVIFRKEALPIEVARGCVFSCAFCKYDLIGKKPGDWTRTLDSLKKEMIRNYEMFGTTRYSISDELINESLDKVKMLCDLSNSLPFKLNYSAYARVDIIYRYPEMRELLLESGAESLVFGVETFNRNVGLNVGKGLDPAKIKKTLHYCKELWNKKIIMTSNFIIGLPGETKDSMMRTFEYLEGADNPLDLYTFTTLGSPKYTRDITVNNTNKIDRNPEKYGYSLVKDKGWVSNSLTDIEINVLHRFATQKPQYRIMHILNEFKWFSRMAPIGFTIDDFFRIKENGALGPEDSEKIALAKTIRNNYYLKLMGLKTPSKS